jgi:hypothetical protein
VPSRATIGSTPGEAPAGAPVVWVVDADHWPRAYLRAELIERGYDAVGFPALRDALTALPVARARGRRPALVVVDLGALDVEPRLLDALGRAGAPVLGVAGAAAAEDELVRAFPWAALVRRPVTIGAIADAVERLITSARA